MEKIVMEKDYLLQKKKTRQTNTVEPKISETYWRIAQKRYRWQLVFIHWTCSRIEEDRFDLRRGNEEN